MDLDKPNQKHKPDSMNIDTVPKIVSESQTYQNFTRPTKPISSYVQYIRGKNIPLYYLMKNI